MQLNKIFIVLFLFCFLVPLIKTDGECDGCNINDNFECSGDSCNQNCRPKFLMGANTCIYCDFTTQNYYIINDDGTCTPRENCNEYEKIVHGSNECVTNCYTNFYKLGDYCYRNQPDNANCDDSTMICRCKYKYHKSETNERELKCLGVNEDCPSGFIFFNYDTKECGTAQTICGDKKIKNQYSEDDGSINYRCSNNCFSNEKLTSDNNNCVDDCTAHNKKYYYPNESDKKTLSCVPNCPNKEQNNECVSSCGGDYYLNELNGNQCINLCPYGFYTEIDGQKICLDETSSSNCFYSQSDASSNNKKCYSSCNELGDPYIYQKGKMCSNNQCDNFYGENSGIKICYDSTIACKNAGYSFYNGNECLSGCGGYIDGDAADNILKYCFSDIDECSSKGYIYFDNTQSSPKCYRSSCHNGLYPKEIEGNKYDCVTCTSSKISKGFCKETCDDDECYFTNSENANNVASNLCKSILDFYYYIDTSGDSAKKICVDNCQSVGKYYFEGKKECVDICKKTENSNDKYLYYDPNDNKCVEQCTNGLYLFAKESTSPNHEKCDTKCPEGFKYLVENTHKCIDGCPNTHPYYYKDTNFNSNGHFICKSVSTCRGDNYLFYDGQCLSPANCYSKDNNFINSKNICVSTCEGGYDFKEKVIEGVYKCLTSCGNKYKINTNECIQECPDGNNFIGLNNVCKPACEEEDGERYYLFQAKSTYSIYKCVSTCPPGFLLETSLSTDKQCYSKCPSETTYKYLLANENKCYDICKDIPSYPFSLSYTENGVQKFICSPSCNTAKPNYEENDKECKSGCALSGKTVIDHDGKCVEQCDTNSIYKYNLDGKCVNKCTGTKNKYYEDETTNEYICTDRCASPKNYILEDKCVPSTSCPNTYFLNPLIKNGVTTGEYECLLGCPNNYFYTETSNGKECVSSCPVYIEDNKCVTDCTNDKFTVEQLLPNDLVTKKECKDDCPYQYPYYVQKEGKHYFLCYNECPIGLRFHQNENPSKIGKECISTDDCPDNTNYKFLSDDEKECLRQCHEKGQKCYDQCPETNPYHYRNGYECYDLEHCPSNPSKYIDYKNNYCVESCSGFKYTYEKRDPENDNTLLYTVCLNDCGLMSKYLTPDNKCIDECLDDDNFNLERDTTVNYKCKCKYKYYSDLSQPIIVCLPETDECADTPQHKIQKINTNECLNK